jgi:hypothetical protein
LARLKWSPLLKSVRLPLQLTYLASYVTALSVLPLEVVSPLPLTVPIEELTCSSPSGRLLPEAISEALGISLSEVPDLYFGGIDEDRQDRLVWDPIDGWWRIMSG